MKMFAIHKKMIGLRMRILSFLVGCILVLQSCGAGETGLPGKSTGYGAEEKPTQHIIDSAQKDTSGTNPDLMMADHIGGIKIGMSLDEVKNLIGTQTSREELQNWGADGRWYATYYFRRVGLQLNVGSDDSLGTNPTVSSITATTNCPLETARWVGIGSSLAEVRNAYSTFIDKEQSNDTVLLAGSVYGGLIFEFEKGKVKKMFLGAAAE